MRTTRLSVILGSVLLVVGCSSVRGESAKGAEVGQRRIGNAPPSRAAQALAEARSIWQATGGASKDFWSHWGDGKAELTGYRMTTMRYGQPRDAELVLIYVTEPLSRRTFIKDDGAAAKEKLSVLKLNLSLKFKTGIYPYSVMTSVFSPVDQYARERFSPAKVALSAQEWCGHVYQQIKPGRASLYSSVRSYFASEGETDERIVIPQGALYEDALLIQLRELDGAFLGGKSTWKGQIVPALWRARKRHVKLAATPASISRADANRDGVPVTRFTVSLLGEQTVYDVEKAAPRRVLGWTSKSGERATLLKTARLPYWNLNGNDSAKMRAAIGLK